MFSGIVERAGVVDRVVREAAGLRLVVAAGFATDPVPGASVAVNGVCLTVERAQGGAFEAVAVPETLRATTLGSLGPGDRVNLERALRVGDELGGHWVQGHVDGIGTVVSAVPEGGDRRVVFEAPEAVRRYLIPKGSIAVDGMSLTVVSWDEPRFAVALVPHTLARTVASEYRPGRRVNLESDFLARALDRMLAARGLLEHWGGAPAPGRNR